MKTRTLGSSDLRVSAIGLGTMSWPGCNYGERDPTGAHLAYETVRSSVRAAIEVGINLFDTAEAYGLGRAEELLGNAMEENSARRQAVIVTKVGPLFGEEQVAGRTCNLSAPHIISRCEGSLRRLRTDYIDLYLAHWPDAATPIEETIEAMAKLKADGKIRHFGVSNFETDLLAAASATSEIAALQLPYSLIERDFEKKQRPLCLARNIGMIAYSPLGKGILSGAYDSARLPPADDYRHGQYHFQSTYLARHLAVARKCSEAARSLGITPAQVALAWCVTQPGISAAIPGGKSATQVRESAEAMAISLPDEVLRSLEN